jgi:SAM-dependent methyltransferase
MNDQGFTGSIPRLYETLLVPMIFAPYAKDLAARLRACQPAAVLELAAGTGALTRELAAVLPADSTIVATDLNEAMLALAAEIGAGRPVTWRQADAMALPFPDACFDAVVCQFGAMFFPDKSKAFAEARRVLRPAGVLMFNVWDGIEDNDFANEITRALAARFPDNPPAFMARTPHGYHEPDRIAADLKAGGFSAAPEFVTKTMLVTASSARVAATAYCQGTPLRGEIEARGMSLADATALSVAALERRFGAGQVEGKIQGKVVTVRA